MAELKHGRVCMLATVGVIVQSFVHLPDPARSAFSNTRPLGALFQVLGARCGSARVVHTHGSVYEQVLCVFYGPDARDTTCVSDDVARFVCRSAMLVSSRVWARMRQCSGDIKYLPRLCRNSMTRYNRGMGSCLSLMSYSCHSQLFRRV